MQNNGTREIILNIARMNFSQQQRFILPRKIQLAFKKARKPTSPQKMFYTKVKNSTTNR